MSGYICSIKWCVALCKPESALCVVHQKGPVHPQPLADGERFVYVPMIGGTPTELPGDDCAECGGTGDCPECDGDGIHFCNHASCHDEHDCGACCGTGKCRECEGAASSRGEIIGPQTGWQKPKPQRLLAELWTGDRARAEAYLRAVYLPAWIPPIEREGA